MKKLLTIFGLLVSIVIQAQNQNKEALMSLFALAPISIFNYSDEGITSEELEDLIKKGESDTWEITFRSNRKLVITCKYPDAELTLSLLTRNNDSPMLLVHTQNAQAYTLETWARNKNNHLEKLHLLPKIETKDFFLKENQSDEMAKYDSNVYFHLDKETSKIHADLYTWMELDFNGKEIDFEINLMWNGTIFEVKKTKRNKE